MQTLLQREQFQVGRFQVPMHPHEESTDASSSWASWDRGSGAWPLLCMREVYLDTSYLAVEDIGSES